MVVALAVSAPPPPGSAAAATPAECAAIDLSPDFARDGTALCVGMRKERIDQPASGVNVFLTTDGGRSWNRRAAVGLPFTPDSKLHDVVFSATYAQDKTVYVQERMTGLYRTTDLGATFTLADPTAAGRDVLPNLTRFAGPLAVPGGVAPSALAWAGELPALLAPPARVPVAGSGPLQAQSFLLPSSFPSRPGYLLSLVPGHQGSVAFSYRVYSCTAALACATEVAAFPVGYRIHAAALVGRDERVVVVGVGALGADAGKVLAWRGATTGGGPLERFPALENLLKPTAAFTHGVGVATLPSGELALLLDHRARDARGIPERQLFVSSRGWSKWSRIAYRKGRGPGGSGALPERDGYAPTYNRSRLWATPKGQLLMIGAAGAHAVSTLFCSRDGRQWKTTC